MESDRYICNETNYTHDSALTECFVVKITVEKCDKMKVAVSQIFHMVKSVALWSANIRKLAHAHRSYGSAAMLLYKIMIPFLIYRISSTKL